MKLQIRYGSDLHEIFVANQDDRIRVQDLLDQIEKQLKVPICHQSLIYKGQRLDQTPTTTLDDLHIFNNSKLILTGTQKRFHNKYCCPDHEHIETNRSSEHEKTIVLSPNQQQEEELPSGFQPEPNKHYE